MDIHVNVPCLHPCRTVEVWPKDIHAGNLTVSHRKGTWRGVGTDNKVSTPHPRWPRKKSSLKYSNTLHRERLCSLLLPTPVCCLLLPSSLQPSASIFFSYFSLSPLPSRSPSFFPLLLCQAPSSLLQDETESVGLIIPDQSFASTSLPALLGSSWFAAPSGITSRRWTHSWILILLPPSVLFKSTKGKMSVWSGQRESMLPVIGVNCMHRENVIYIGGCLIYVKIVPAIAALKAAVLGLRSSFLLLWKKPFTYTLDLYVWECMCVFEGTYAQLSYNRQNLHFSILSCIMCFWCFHSAFLFD